MKVPTELEPDGISETPTLDEVVENGNEDTQAIREALAEHNERLLQNLKEFEVISEDRQKRTHDRMISMLDRFDKYVEQKRGDAGL